MVPPQASAPEALSVEHVIKEFGVARALDDVSISVPRGQVLGLVGQNGAGKSTLVKILSGRYPHGSYDGTVRVDGHEAVFGSERDAIAHGVGVVPQETAVIDALTVAENVVLGQVTSRTYWPPTINRRAQKFLDERRIPLNATDLARDISPSDRQLLMIARTLFAKPTVLLLDEPTTALATDEVDGLFDIVRSLRNTGVTTILISHKLSEIFDVCDRVAVLRDGRVADDLDRGEFDPARVVESIVGRQVGELYPTRPSRPDDAADVLRVENLTVYDPLVASRRVVDEVSLHVKAGEVVGLGGALGSGRTEILEAIYGLRRYDGSIAVDGEATKVTSPFDAIAAAVGLVPEDRKNDGLFYNLDVEDNLTVTILDRLSSRRLIDTRERQLAARRAVADFGVKTPSLRATVGELSGGNQQKVLIARSLIAGPRLLLLDEPTKGVDIGAKAEIYQLISELVGPDLGVLAVFSDTSELVGFCDRVVVLNRGKVEREVHCDHTNEEELLLAALSGTDQP